MRWPPLRIALYVGLAAALLNIVSAPFHGAAYFATEDGSTELAPHQEAWGAWVREHVPGAFVGGPDAAYLFWGKFTALSLALSAFALAGLHGAQDARLSKAGRIVGRAMVATWSTAAAFAIVLYFIAVIDAVFLAMLPFLLASLVLTAIYGVRTARARLLPRRIGWALFACGVAFIPLVAIAGHIPFGMLGLSALWIIAAPVLLRQRASVDTAETPA